jgi:hypothetical protein
MVGESALDRNLEPMDEEKGHMKELCTPVYEWVKTMK